MKQHTILLYQYGKNEQGRKWNDYENLEGAMTAICQLFEDKLKKQHSNMSEITYDGSDLLKFVDEMTDLAIMIYSPQTQSYSPFGKNWIKEKLVAHLKRQISN